MVRVVSSVVPGGLEEDLGERFSLLAVVTVAAGTGCGRLRLAGACVEEGPRNETGPRKNGAF